MITTTRSSWARRHASAVAACRKLLEDVAGLDVTKDGLAATPERMARALEEMTAGRNEIPEEILATTFPANGYDELVVVRGIDFTSLCEHHVLPFIGQVHVAYLPGKRIVGLSKIPRLVDAIARRLQIQERITQLVAAHMQSSLKPRGVMVVVEARHECAACRGVKKPNVVMVTSAVRGIFLENAAARAEALALLRPGS